MRKDQAPISKFAESRSGSEYTPFRSLVFVYHVWTSRDVGEGAEPGREDRQRRQRQRRDLRNGRNQAPGRRLNSIEYLE